MTILFCGGELDDFVTAGTVSHQTTSTFYRSTYARVALQVATSTWPSNYATAAFTASSAFSVAARVYLSSTTFSAGAVWLALSSGGATSARLRLKMSAASPSTIVLETYNGTSATTLATSTSTVTAGALYRLDVAVDYQAAGRVRVWIDGALYIDYSGDVTAAGSTTLNQLHLASARTTINDAYWSEVIVCTQDSRTLSLVTLAPNAAGTANAWTGAYTDIDETTASETDVIVSGTANQIFNCNCTGMPAGWANLTVTAVKVTASAARGSSGPSKLAVGCRTNSADSFPTSVTIDTGYTTPYTTLYQTNPVTGVAWSTTEVDAFQIALKSET